MSTLLSRLGRRIRHLRHRLGDPVLTAALVVAAAGLAASALAWPSQLRATVVLSLPVLFGGLLLGRRPFRIVLAAAVLLLVVNTEANGLQTLRVGGVVLFGTIAVVSYVQARRRDLLGVRGARSDVILRELRDRLLVQGAVPTLPAGWGAETELRPAHGLGMAGDFVVSRLDGPPDAPVLDLALVDVSGKGVEAGTRALLLSGALGGLLGAVPPERFLTEANRYLRRQRWSEGFATAVHLRVDLATGDYRVASAGHPPAVHFSSGSGHWQLAPSRGPLLGVRDEVQHRPDVGRLRPGDALLLYTDGLIENRRQDLEVGLDRLLGAAERLISRGGFRGGAAQLVAQAPSRTDDDRAAVLLWRERVGHSW